MPEISGLAYKQAVSLIESDRRINIWHGSVRSGKTFISVLRFLTFCAEMPEGNLLMAGKTLTTLYRNIILPMQEMIGDDKECHYIGSTKTLALAGRNIMLEGANDESSEQKIRGTTLAGAYCDEVTLWPESFWTMLLSRCSVPGAKIFATTNPDSSYHWLKTDYIDRQHELNMKVFHFHIDDNETLTADYVDSLKKEYTGLWYRRFIDGEWCQAEGAIYDMWDEARHTVRAEDMPKKFDGMFAACDYGTTNPFAAGVFGVLDGKLYLLKEYHYDSNKQMRQKTDGEYASDMERFLSGYGDIPLIIDPSAASFRVECQKRRIPVKYAVNDVLNGIRFVAQLLATGRLFICKDCKETIREFTGYVWDARAQARGVDAPLKQNDHHCVSQDTLVWTDKGPIPIGELVGTTGFVRSLNEKTGEIEWAPYHSVALTRRSAPLLEVKLEDGSVLRCTPDHEILTKRGRVRADELTEDDEVEVMPDGYFRSGYPPFQAESRRSTMRLKVKSIRVSKTEDVFCLTVPELHNFAAGQRGIFIGNCDAVRYAVMSLGLWSDVAKQHDTSYVFG
jgi:PBSX family phage terminase large subunit